MIYMHSSVSMLAVRLDQYVEIHDALPSPLPVSGVMEQSPELPACSASNLFSSQRVYIHLYVLLLNVGQSFWKALRYVWEEYCIAPA